MIKNILGSDFKYEEDKFYRLDKRNNKWSCCNDIKPRSTGYIQIIINNKMYQLHRIIYKYFNDDWNIIDNPRKNPVDHININKLDNRIENLRVATCSQNTRNQNKKKNCSSKYRGVSLENNKWRAQISIDGKKKHLGSFDNEEEAAKAYKKKYDEIMSII